MVYQFLANLAKLKSQQIFIKFAFKCMQYCEEKFFHTFYEIQHKVVTFDNYLHAPVHK